MKIGLCSIARKLDPLDEVVAEAAELGCEAIELWGQPPHLTALTEEAGARAAAVVRGAGLATTVLGSYLRPGAADFAAQLPGVLAAAHGYGARLVRVWAGGVSDARADQAVWDQVIADFERLLGACGDLVLSIERHGGTLAESAEGAARLLDRLPDARVTLNFQYARGVDTAGTIAEIHRFWPRISNVHAQNVRDGVPWDLAGGDLDYQAILRALATLGYDGLVEVEFIRLGGQTSDLTASQRRAALAADLDHLRQALAAGGA